MIHVELLSMPQDKNASSFVRCELPVPLYKRIVAWLLRREVKPEYIEIPKPVNLSSFLVRATTKLELGKKYAFATNGKVMFHGLTPMEINTDGSHVCNCDYFTYIPEQQTRMEFHHVSSSN